MLRQSNAQAMKATAICTAAKSRHAFQPREKSIQPTAMDITSIEVMPTPMWISTLSHVGSSVPYISEAIPKIAPIVNAAMQLNAMPVPTSSPLRNPRMMQNIMKMIAEVLIPSHVDLTTFFIFSSFTARDISSYRADISLKSCPSDRSSAPPASRRRRVARSI